MRGGMSESSHGKLKPMIWQVDTKRCKVRIMEQEVKISDLEVNNIG
jgi:hypothetical protein